MQICYLCGHHLEVIKDQPYKFTECGLDVILYGVTQFRCSSCKESYSSIPNLPKLHRVIGTHICKNRKALLQPEEIKFLRKDLHLKAKELSSTLGVTPSTVSRWENGKKAIGETYDRLLRSIYMMYASEQARYVLCDGALDLFRDLPTKRKKIKQPTEISLNPQEWLSDSVVDCYELENR